MKLKVSFLIVIFNCLQILGQPPMDMEMVEPERAEKTSLTELEYSLKRGSASISKWDRIPDIVLETTDLGRLNIYESYELTSLPKEIKQFHQLKYLFLTGTGLEKFPVEITKITSLVELQLSSSYYTNIDNSIGDLINLKKFHIRSLPIESLPAEFSNLTQLEELSINNTVGNYKMGDRVLQLPGLNSLPEDLGNIVKLKKLNLNRNALTSIPESIGKLNQLEFLQIAFNPLESLPESIGSLESLRILDLSGTNITTLPESIKNLKQLRSLKLYKTQVKTEDLITLKKHLPSCAIIDAAGNRVKL